MSFRSTLYVGNVAYSSDEADLTQLFSQYGNVLSTEIKRGFAFVKFDTIEAAQSAAQGLDNHLFNGRNLRVNFSKSEPHPSRSSFPPLNDQISTNVNSQQPTQPQRVPYKENSIHVGNLHPHITEEELRQEFEKYGILAIHIINARNCFAIIELSSAENTAKVLAEVRGLNIGGREVAISKQLQLPERNNFQFRGRGFRGRGRGRGFYGHNYQRNTQTFVLHNNLHNQNNNINDVDSNGNHINNSQIQNSFEDSQGGRFPKYHNNYRGNIFGVRGGYGGRGGYRGRGSYGRSRGRGSFQSRGDNVLFSIPNPSS